MIDAYNLSLNLTNLSNELSLLIDDSYYHPVQVCSCDDLVLFQGLVRMVS